MTFAEMGQNNRMMIVFRWLGPRMYIIFCVWAQVARRKDWNKTFVWIYIWGWYTGILCVYVYRHLRRRHRLHGLNENLFCKRMRCGCGRKTFSHLPPTTMNLTLDGRPLPPMLSVYWIFFLAFCRKICFAFLWHESGRHVFFWRVPFFSSAVQKPHKWCQSRCKSKWI